MKFMKKLMKITSLALALVCAAGVATGCGGTKGDPKTLVIGGTGPLTGEYASYGNSVKNGAEIAVEEINAAGGINGIKFEVKFEDDQGDPQTAVNAYSTLVDKGMQVSLGAVTSGACVALTEEAKKDGMLLLTPSGSQKECTQYDNCFRICFTDPDQGTYAAQFIKDNAIGSKVGIIYEKSNDYSNGITETFLAKAKEIGLEVVDPQAFTDQSNTDFSVQLQALKDAGIDLLFLPIYYENAAKIITQADKAGMKVTIFGVDGMDGIIKQMGEENKALTEGILLLTPFAADSTDAKTAAFVKTYQEKFNATPDQFAADGYDAVYTIAAALTKSGITDTTVSDLNAQLIAAMTQITVEGVTGTMTWSADGEPTKSAKAVKIVDGVYKAY